MNNVQRKLYFRLEGRRWSLCVVLVASTLAQLAVGQAPLKFQTTSSGKLLVLAVPAQDARVPTTDFYFDVVFAATLREIAFKNPFWNPSLTLPGRVGIYKNQDLIGWVVPDDEGVSGELVDEMDVSPYHLIGREFRVAVGNETLVNESSSGPIVRCLAPGDYAIQAQLWGSAIGETQGEVVAASNPTRVTIVHPGASQGWHPQGRAELRYVNVLPSPVNSVLYYFANSTPQAMTLGDRSAFMILGKFDNLVLEPSEEFYRELHAKPITRTWEPSLTVPPGGIWGKVFTNRMPFIENPQAMRVVFTRLFFWPSSAARQAGHQPFPYPALESPWYRLLPREPDTASK